MNHPLDKHASWAAMLILTSPLSVGAASLSISGNPPATGTVGQEYRFLPVVTDAATTQLEFDYVNKPGWTKGYRSDGLILGTPTEPGTYPDIQIGVWDGVHYAVLPPFTIKIVLPATSSYSVGTAYLSWTKAVLNDEGSALPNLAAYVIRYGTDTEAPRQLTVNSPWATEAEIAGLVPGDWYFEIAALNTDHAQSGFSARVTTVIQ